MTIYAIFLCFQLSNSCQMYGAARMELGEYRRALTYPSLSVCQDEIKKLTPYHKPTNGRFIAGPQMWYECRGKHVETWEPAK